MPSGEIFRRPSSVRRITSGATPIRSGADRQDAGDFIAIVLVLDECRRCEPMRAHEFAERVRIVVRPARANGQHFLAARSRISDTKCRMWPMPRSTATALHGAHRRRWHQHACWRDFPPCRAAATRSAVHPGPDRHRPPPSRSGADNCASNTGRLHRKVSGSSPRPSIHHTLRASARADTIGSARLPSAAACKAASNFGEIMMALPFSPEVRRPRSSAP